MCYIHSPKILHEVSQCLSKFKEYREAIKGSIRAAALEMTMELMKTRLDMSTVNKSMFLDTTDGYQNYLNLDGSPRFGSAENVFDPSGVQDAEKVLRIDIKLETPVIVLPKTPVSHEVLIAQLGQIGITNFDREEQDKSVINVQQNRKQKRLLVDIQDMNLCSACLDSGLNPHYMPDTSHSQSFIQVNIDQFGYSAKLRDSHLGGGANGSPVYDVAVKNVINRRPIYEVLPPPQAICTHV